MADEPNTYDTGEPRFGNPIWMGRYSLSPSEGVTFDSTTVMLTKDNTVQFIGNANGVTANSPFATLPNECSPFSSVVIPVYCKSSPTVLAIDVDSDGNLISASDFGSADSPIMAPLTISSNGDLSVPYDGTVLLNGIEFQINDRYYR